jgi:type 1 glutamine amidotransferase
MRDALLAVLMMAALPISAGPRLIVVTATEGFRHDSIETAEQVIAALAPSYGIDVVHARTDVEMLERLAPAELQSAAAVMFVNTSGELPAAAREALLEWVRAGGTFIGVHSAADTWHSSPDYIEMVGAEFVTHPPESTVSVFVEDRTHKATVGVASPQVIFEEIYVFTNFDPARVKLLLSLREPEHQPLAWEKTYGAGRVFYTALGHRIDVWTSPWYQRHIGGALLWALGHRKARAVRH